MFAPPRDDRRPLRGKTVPTRRIHRSRAVPARPGGEPWPPKAGHPAPHLAITRGRLLQLGALRPVARAAQQLDVRDGIGAGSPAEPSNSGGPRLSLLGSTRA